MRRNKLKEVPSVGLFWSSVESGQNRDVDS